MSWRFHGRAHPDPSSPRSQGQCDRCSFYYQLSDLKFQYEWRGQTLVNTWFRVCPTCLDVPAEFLRTLQFPADPVPVQYPRVPPVEMQMSGTQIQQWDPPPTYPSINPPTQSIALGAWDSGSSNWDEG